MRNDVCLIFTGPGAWWHSLVMEGHSLATPQAFLFFPFLRTEEKIGLQRTWFSSTCYCCCQGSGKFQCLPGEPYSTWPTPLEAIGSCSFPGGSCIREKRWLTHLESLRAGSMEGKGGGGERRAQEVSGNKCPTRITGTSFLQGPLFSAT